MKIQRWMPVARSLTLDSVPVVNGEVEVALNPDLGLAICELRDVEIKCLPVTKARVLVMENLILMAESQVEQFSNPSRLMMGRHAIRMGEQMLAEMRQIMGDSDAIS